jgi:filamentous hemagglutinin family protein
MWVPQSVHAGDIEGAHVVQGSASIVAGIDPSITNITASDRAIIEYQQFNIASQNSVNFIQPSANAAVLNRIIGNSPSALNGTLNANGIVYFVNPAGVYFGPNAVISAAQFHAAAGNISNEDFTNGINRFTATGNLLNEGSIHADNGVYLVGQSVTNTGTIIAANGLVSLSSGDTQYLADSSSRVLVKVDSLNAQSAGRAAETNATGTGVTNTGTVEADEVVFSSGDVYSLAINNAGTVKSNTTVTIASAGDVVTTGSITAGGKVDIAGDDVDMAAGTISAVGQLNVFANTLNLGPIALSAGVGGQVLLDPVTLDVNDATAIITAMNSGSGTTLQAQTSINVNTAIDTSGQVTTGALTFADENADNTLTINLNAPITLGTSQTLTGQGTIVNVNHTTNGGIQNGIDVAAEGGTVNVAPGLYNITSTIQLNKAGVSLVGPQAGVDPRTSDVVVVDGVATEQTVTTTRDVSNASTEAILDGGGTTGTIINISASDTKIDGFVVTASSGDMIFASGGLNNVTVQYNITYDSNDEAIQFKGTNNGTIQYNRIYDVVGEALNVSDYSSNNVLQYNQISDIRTSNAAIYTYTDSENNTVQYNTITDVPNCDVIKFGPKDSGSARGTDQNESGGSILYNVISDSNYDGIVVYMSDTLVQGNTVYNTWGDHGGIYVAFNVDNVTINSNHVHDNAHGIKIGANNSSHHPTTITITDNTINDNGDGIVYYGGDAPTVTGNVLLGNGIHYNDPTGLSDYTTIVSSNTFDQGGYIEGDTRSGAFTIGGEDIEALIEGAADGAVVHIFQGSYTLTDAISISQSIDVSGAGRDATIIRRDYSGASSYAHVFDVSASSDVTIADMTIGGINNLTVTDGVVTNWWGYLIGHNSGYSPTDNLTIDNVHMDGGRSGILTSGDNVVITNSLFDGYWHRGTIRVNGGSFLIDSNIFKGLHFQYGALQIEENSQPQYEGIFSNNLVQSNANPGYFKESGNVFQIEFYNPNIGPGGLIITGNTFDGTTFDPGTPNQDDVDLLNRSIYFEFDYVGNPANDNSLIQITNNSFSGFHKGGIFAPVGATITGNTFENNERALILLDATLSDNATTEAAITDSVDNNTFNQSIFYATGPDQPDFHGIWATQQEAQDNAGPNDTIVSVMVNNGGDAGGTDNVANALAGAQPNSNGQPNGSNGGGTGGGNVQLALGDNALMPFSMQMALNDNANGGGNIDPELAAQLDQMFDSFLNDQLNQFQLALNDQYSSYLATVSADLTRDDKMAGFSDQLKKQDAMSAQFKELLVMIDAIEKLAKTLGLDEAEARKMLYEKVKPANMSADDFEALIQAYRQQQQP